MVVIESVFVQGVPVYVCPGLIPGVITLDLVRFMCDVCDIPVMESLSVGQIKHLPSGYYGYRMGLDLYCIWFDSFLRDLMRTGTWF
jgi:hypothetical protein